VLFIQYFKRIQCVFNAFSMRIQCVFRAYSYACNAVEEGYLARQVSQTTNNEESWKCKVRRLISWYISFTD